MKYSSAESEYLVELIKSAIKAVPVPSPAESIDWNGFVKLARKQQVYAIIAPVLGNIDMPKEQADELKLYNQNELVRIIAMKNQLEKLEQDLSDRNIKYMLVKGSVIRECYPQQKMRQMSDMDILYDYSKRSELIRLMKSNGFRMTDTCENSDDFFKEPYYTFEFHRELFFEEMSFCPHFDLWKSAVQDSENPCKYHIEDNEHFVYTICHMYKHYSTKGCGIRFLCDIYVLMNKLDIDLDKAYDRFKDIGIKEFAEDAIALSQAVFNNLPVTDNQQRMLDFLLSSGVYGNNYIDYSLELEKYGGSKFKYIFAKLFPSKDMMKREYPVLNKHGYLLVILYIARIAKKLRYNSAKAKQEIKGIKSVKK